MGVLWATTIEATSTTTMVGMEGGIGPRFSLVGFVLGLTHMEDHTRPCWAWISNQMDVSGKHSITR